MTETKYNIEGVIFDLGSTLLEYETVPWDIIFDKCTLAGFSFLKDKHHNIPDYDLFRERQIEIRTKYRKEAEKTLKEWSLIDGLAELLESYDINSGSGMAEEYFSVFYGPIAKQLSIFADTVTVLTEIKKRGLKLGLISNTIFPEEYHVRELKHFQIHDYFDDLIFSVTHGYRKPHISIYKSSVENLNIDPSKLLFVGDRYIEDVKGPKDFGMNAILKYRENRDYPDPLPRDLIVVHSLSEILRHIA